MRTVFILTMLCAVCSTATAQKILKLYHGKKALEYNIGDELHFQLEGQDFFYTFEIKDLDHGSQSILFPTGLVKVKDIVAIKSYKNYRTANIFSKMFYTFGTSWVGFSVFDILYRGSDLRQVAGDALIVGSTSFVAGYLLKRYWATRTYELGNDENLLYIVDLEVGEKE